MSNPDVENNGPGAGGNPAREQLLDATLATERRLMLAGTRSACAASDHRRCSPSH
jgi:hypothetical protein